MRVQHKESGYALVTVLFLAAVLVLLLGTAVPRVLTQGQREKEEELIFRGEQYARAIRLYYRRYGRFPAELDELVRVNNSVRFLRKLYKDPMTPEGRWRLIRVGAGGRLTGNVVERPPLKIPPAAPAVRTTTPTGTPPRGPELPSPQPLLPPTGQEGQPPSEQPQEQPTPPTPRTGRWPLPPGVAQPSEVPTGGETTPRAGEVPQQEQPVIPGFPTGLKTGKPMPGEPLTEVPSPIPGLPPQTVPVEPAKPVLGEEERPPFNPEEDTTAPREPVEQEQPETPPAPPPPAVAQAAPAPGTPLHESEPQVFGGGIAGVASTSTRAAIRLYRNHSQYNEWEFIYDPGAELAGAMLVPGQPGTLPPGMQPPGKQVPPAPPSRLSPFGPPAKR